MGRNEEEWTKLGALMEEAGADVVECNFSCPNMTDNFLLIFSDIPYFLPGYDQISARYF